MASNTNLIPLLIITLSTLLILNSAVVLAVREGELNVVFGVLRARGYHLFANALATSDVHYDLKGNGNFTLFAPINSALFAIDMTMAASNYVSALRYHVVPRRMTIADLLSLPPPANVVPTLVSGQDIVVEQRRSRRSLITVGGVDIVVPGMFYGRDIAVHGLEGILEYRSHSRNPPPASSAAANVTVSGASLSGNLTLPEIVGNYTFQFPSPSPPPPPSGNDNVSVQSPVAPNQAPIMTRAKLLELSSEGMYGVSSVREPVGDRLRHFSLADDCSVADNSGHLVEDVDLREVHGGHMICAQ
nr:hypothetical protein [Tanacetum cinerariifolium]